MKKEQVLSQRLVSFGMIGFGVFVVGLCLQALLVASGVSVVPAFVLQLIATLWLSYELSCGFTWRDAQKDAFTAIKFFAPRSAVAFLSIFAFAILTENLGVNHLIANALTVAGGMVVNFVVSHFYTFQESPRLTSKLEGFVSKTAKWSRQIRRIKVVVVVVAVVLIAVRFGSYTLPAVIVLVACVTLFQVPIQLFLRFYKAQNADEVASTRFPAPYEKPRTSFSLLVPAKGEEAVIGKTLTQLRDMEYPASLFEVLPTLRLGDLPTIREAERVAATAPGIVKVHVNKFEPNEKKSGQMNRTLTSSPAGEGAFGEFIGVFDAESIGAKGLLSGIDAVVQDLPDVDIVIGTVALTNLDTVEGPWWRRIARGWFAPFNVLEYYYQFSRQMFFQKDIGVMPLPGNTLFVRTELLKRAGGWNDERLTEDADLGIRLNTEFGAKVEVRYTPDLATREHTPPQVFGAGGLFRQRRRWDQGFWQVLRDGKWLRLRTFKQRFMAGYILATPILQAVNGLMLIPAFLAALYLKMPVALTLFLYFPLGLNVVLMALQLIDIGKFGRLMKVKVEWIHYVELIIGYMPYQGLLALAAIDAVRREASGNNTWDSTARNATAHASNVSTLVA